MREITKATPHSTVLITVSWWPDSRPPCARHSRGCWVRDHDVVTVDRKPRSNGPWGTLGAIITAAGKRWGRAIAPLRASCAAAAWLDGIASFALMSLPPHGLMSVASKTPWNDQRRAFQP